MHGDHNKSLHRCGLASLGLVTYPIPCSKQICFSFAKVLFILRCRASFAWMEPCAGIIRLDQISTIFETIFWHNALKPHVHVPVNLNFFSIRVNKVVVQVVAYTTSIE